LPYYALYDVIKGIGGGPGPKIYISFILIYATALSFFFPKWGSIIITFDFMSIYVKGVLSNIRGKCTL